MKRSPFIWLLCPLWVLFFWQVPVDNSWQDKIAPAVLERAQDGETVDFLVLLTKQADVSAAKDITTKNGKGQFVFQKLSTLAANSQQRVLEILEKKASYYRPFYIVNAIHAKGDYGLLEQLAQLPEVAGIQSNPVVKLEVPMESSVEIQPRNTMEWGLERIGVNKVWNMGYSGQGVVIAGEDTGYDWTHPALKPRYRGWNGARGNHNYNWHDAIHELNPLHEDPDPTLTSVNPCGLSSPYPCDDHNHGTHTMGTMVGDDGTGNQIGVAPGAKWIACRNMERGYGTPATYIECFEWFLAPTDLNQKNPDPTKAPDIINNSWSCPEIEGCNASNWKTMETVVNNLKTAGIFVVSSAGNTGSDCGTIDRPSAMFENAFTIGATTPADTIADFSSRGAVSIDGSYRIKPNIVAPGVNIRSCIRGEEYASWNGTSMAAPHIAGVVALMLSAAPELAGQVETIETILETTSRPLYSDQNCNGISGNQIPNNVYGYGMVDAHEAVKEAIMTISNVLNRKPDGHIQVFPNPFHDQISFHFTSITGRVSCEIFDATGRPVLNKRWIIYGTTQRHMQFAKLPAGVYYYRLSDGQQIHSGKIVKK